MDQKEVLVSSSEAHGLVVQLVGRFTMQDSPCFHQLVCRTLDSAVEMSAIVDLIRCDYLDSTFLGCLVKVHKRYRGRIVVASDSASTERLLKSCHLHHVLQLVSESPPVSTHPISIPAQPTDRVDFGHHVLTCHRQLAAIESPSQAAFHRIVAQLERELNNSSS